jgi:arylsulfatase A-like enzyme
VLVLAKAGLWFSRLLEGGARDLVSLWVPCTFLYPAIYASLLFLALDLTVSRLTRARLEPALWGVYALWVAWTAINVPVARVFSTPLTLTLLEGAGGALIDSILPYATPANAAAVGLLGVAGFYLPRVLARMLPSRLNGKQAAALGACLVSVVIIGSLGARELVTLGLHRDPTLALAESVLARLLWSRAPKSVPMLSPSGPLVPLSDLAGVARGRSVLWVSLESTAAEYLAPYGGRPDPMPRLTALARDALIFEAAYSVYPGSMKALFAMLCARYPAPFTSTRSYRKAPCAALPEALRRAGYRTGMFHSGRFDYLDMRDIVEGRGFEVLYDATNIRAREETAFGIDEPSTVQSLLAQIDSMAEGEPFFLLYAPIAGHHPYHWPSGTYPFGRDSQRALYLGDLARGDQALGVLIDGLAQRGRLEKTVVILSGDHGEAFYQHPGNWAHPLFIFDENVRVPLIVAAPGLLHGARRVPQPASLVDVAPTLLALLGVSAHRGSADGRSLLGGPPGIPHFFTDFGIPQVGLRDGRWKFILDVDTERMQLYDETQPGERTNLAASEPARSEHYRAHLRAWWHSVRAR